MAAAKKSSGRSGAANLNTMRTLAEDIRQQSFRRVYLLYGSESYLRVQFRTRLRNAMADPNDTMNVTFFSGKSINEKEIIRTADTFPFFAERRVIIIKDSGFFKSAHKELTDYIARIPETTCLIFEEENVDTKNTLFKAVAEHGLAAQLNFPDDASLRQWLLGMLSSAGKKIRSSNLEYLISLVTPDMNALQTETEKLIAYTGTNTEITKADIDAICSVNIENKIFDLIRASAEKKQGQALRLYHDIVLLQNAQDKSQRSSGMSILSRIMTHFDHLYEIKSLREGGLPPDIIAQRSGLQTWLVRKNLPLSEQLSFSYLRSVLSECTVMEESIKSGQISETLAAEILITRLSGK